MARDPSIHGCASGWVGLVLNESEVSGSKERNFSSPTLRSKITEWAKKPMTGSKSLPGNTFTNYAETDGNASMSISDPQVVESYNCIVTARENVFAVWNNFSVSYKNLTYDFNDLFKQKWHSSL